MFGDQNICIPWVSISFMYQQAMRADLEVRTAMVHSTFVLTCCAAICLLHKFVSQY